MLATLVLAAALQPLPAQNAKLELKNVRNTYGYFGAERKDNKLLPGDVFVVSFDIEGLQTKETGEIAYSMGTELLKKDGKENKSQFKNAPVDLKAFNLLGSPRLPAYAHVILPLDTAPGEYTFIVTVSDGKATQKLEQKFEVVPLKLGIVGVAITDAGGATPMPPAGFVGQKLYLSYALVGFDLDKEKKMNPDVTFEFWIFDKDGKKTFTKAPDDVEKAIKDPSVKLIPRFYELPLTRSGTFTVQLKATDKISGKSVEEKVTITVLDPPK